MSADQGQVLAIAVGCVVAVGAVGALALRPLRRRSLGVQLLAIPVVVLAALAGAVYAEARVMFLSAHDSGVMALTLLTGAPLGVALAVLLRRDVARSARGLAAAARLVGAGQTPAPDPHPAAAELAAVHRELAGAAVALAEARRREIAVETSRRELVAWVAHDLRTPLAGIRAMAEALEDGVAEDPDLYVKRLRIESDRLAGMVDTLFLLSRMNAGALRPVPEPLAVRDLVSDAVASIAPVARTRGVRLAGGAEPDVVADVDAAQLSRALTNLLSNAVRHTPAGGTVTVTAVQLSDRVRLAVQDACGGIPQSQLPRVFDIGWRGDRARSGGTDAGAGLGLAVTRGVVEAHGGQVRVVNAGQGCRFEVDLPSHGAPPGWRPEPAPPETVPPG